MAQDDELDSDYDDGSSSEHTYLTFLIEGEEYAVPVQHVTEIVRLPRAFAIPDVPSYVRGVINLRGKVIPLVDIRARFGMVDAGYTDRTVVVVVEVDQTSTGLVVDGVSEVVEILPERVESRRHVGHEDARSMISGVGILGERVVFLVEVRSVLMDAPVTGTSAERGGRRELILGEQA